MRAPLTTATLGAALLLAGTAAPAMAHSRWALSVDYLHEENEREFDTSGVLGSGEDEVDGEADGVRLRLGFGGLRDGRLELGLALQRNDFDRVASFEDIGSREEDMASFTVSYLGTFGRPYDLVPRWKIGGGFGFVDADEDAFEDDTIYNIEFSGGLGLDYVINEAFALSLMGEAGARVWQEIEVRTSAGDQSIDTTDTFFRLSAGITFGL